MLIRIVLIFIFIWTGTFASTLYKRVKKDNDNYLDLEDDKDDSIYPIADEINTDINSLNGVPRNVLKSNPVTQKVKKSTPKSKSSTSPSPTTLRRNFDKDKEVVNNIDFKSRQRQEHEEEVLTKEIKLLFKNYGRKPSDLPNIFLPNSNLFSPEVESTMTTKKTTTDGTTRDKSMRKGQVDEYSLSNFREKINGIIEKNQGVKEDLRGLLRGYQKNQTLLIAMIQAAVQQWAETDKINLPPPFGTLNESSHLNISDDLREELLDLSDLLTKDLRDRLIEILAVDSHESVEEMSHEFAVVEQDEDGNVNITVHQGDSTKPKRETLSSGDDFTITEDLPFDDYYGDEDSNQNTREFGDDGKMSNEYLENIIRQEHKEEESLKSQKYDGQGRLVNRQRFDYFSPKRTKRVKKSIML